MPRPPRLADVFGSAKPKPKRHPFVTQDGTTIARNEAMPASCIGEAMPIWGEPIAMDARPKPSGLPVTFDSAIPDTRKHKETR